MASRLSQWLSEQMRDRSLGRNALARRSGVSEATLTRIIRYDHVPGPDMIFTLADFFGADRDTVLEIAGLVQLSDLPAEMPAEIRDLARRLYRLPPADRQAILRHFDQTLKLVEDRAPRRDP
jgi:plasmid maintenance system antidote protein VapI